MILVATQVIEVGLDITCRALHTETAPASSVLQRAGRCARYQRETGDVFIYDVENYAPYGGSEAKAQCERTWEWLDENQGRHLDFGDEQALINYAHGPSDRSILDALQSGSFERSQQIQALWQGEGDRGDAIRLIRDVQSQTLVVHSDPDRLLERPFTVESFSLHPGTVRGKFDQWQDFAQDDIDRDALPFAVCRLIEAMDDDSTQSNRPPTYDWVPVRSKHELAGASLLVVHPSLVGYRQDLGFTLYQGEHYEASVPTTKKREWEPWSYRKESYHEHVELVYEAFSAKEAELAAAGRRLEERHDWPQGSVSSMAHLVVCLHDLGKLDRRWQGWAQQWQKAIGLDHNDSYALAHTDYDGYDDRHRQLERKLRGQRPHHAVESALAAVHFLAAITGGPNHPLFRAGFSAIARHHAPQSWQSGGYQLIERAPFEIQETLAMLPGDVLQPVVDVLDTGPFQTALTVSKEVILNNLLLRVDDSAEVCAYMLMARALRQADQEGTSKGAVR